MKIKKSKIKNLAALLIVFVVFIFLIKNIDAVPQYPLVTSASTNTGPAVSMSRADAGGTITTLLLNANQQDDAWKGYVGNVTGSLSLKDSFNYTLYDWAVISFTGEIYSTTASSVTWTSVQCSNYGNISAQYTGLNMVETDVDSINQTFNTTIHSNFFVGSVNISNSSCQSIVTFVNGTRQNVSEEADFQEVLLSDAQSLIFASILEQNERSYNNLSYDFQMIVPDSDSGSTITTYYFYVELTK